MALRSSDDLVLRRSELNEKDLERIRQNFFLNNCVNDFTENILRVKIKVPKMLFQKE